LTPNLLKYEFGLLVGKRSIPRHYGQEEFEEDIAYARGEEYLPDYEFCDHWSVFPFTRPIWRGPDSKSSTWGIASRREI